MKKFIIILLCCFQQVFAQKDSKVSIFSEITVNNFSDTFYWKESKTAIDLYKKYPDIEIYQLRVFKNNNKVAAFIKNNKLTVVDSLNTIINLIKALKTITKNY